MVHFHTIRCFKVCQQYDVGMLSEYRYADTFTEIAYIIIYTRKQQCVYCETNDPRDVLEMAKK